jgi:putative transposase
MMDIPDSKTVNTNERAVGIDVGIKCIAATSDGVIYDNPKWLREAQRELRVKQRKLSRRKLGSNRRAKAKQEVTKLHEKIANQRSDHLHKITRELVEQYGFIAIEDLSLAFMNRNRHLALSSYDAGLGMFRSYLEYKAADAGVEVVAVNPSYTSQVCSGCGCLVPKKLSVRTHRCSDCGLELDRDVNAAVNILTKAKQTLGQSVRDVTWTELRSCVSREAVAL